MYERGPSIPGPTSAHPDDEMFHLTAHNLRGNEGHGLALEARRLRETGQVEEARRVAARAKEISPGWAGWADHFLCSTRPYRLG